MNSLASLAGESPNPDPGESPNPNNAAIPGEDPDGGGGDQGESQGIAELLDEDGDSKTSDGESQKDTPARLIDQAEKLGLKPEELYALTVAFDDGKTMTVGELKDLGKEATDFESASLELEGERQEQEAKFTRMHGELRELIAALPKSVRTEKTFTDAAEKYEARLAEARAAADSAIEAWSDPDVKKAEQAEIGTFLKDYGFEEDYLDKVLDPRSLRLIRDAARLSKRVQAAMAKLKKGKPDKKPANSGASGPAGKRPASPGKASTTTVSKRYDELLDS